MQHVAFAAHHQEGTVFALGRVFFERNPGPHDLSGVGQTVGLWGVGQDCGVASVGTSRIAPSWGWGGRAADSAGWKVTG